MFHVFVIVSGLLNERIASYGAPEMYKIVKDNKNVLYFGNLEECNVIDVTGPMQRKFRKKLKPGDAYLFTANDLVKVKTPLIRY